MADNNINTTPDYNEGAYELAHYTYSVLSGLMQNGVKTSDGMPGQKGTPLELILNPTSEQSALLNTLREVLSNPMHDINLDLKKGSPTSQSAPNSRTYISKNALRMTIDLRTPATINADIVVSLDNKGSLVSKVEASNTPRKNKWDFTDYNMVVHGTPLHGELVSIYLIPIETENLSRLEIQNISGVDNWDPEYYGRHIIVPDIQEWETHPSNSSIKRLRVHYDLSELYRTGITIPLGELVESEGAVRQDTIDKLRILNQNLDYLRQRYPDGMVPFFIVKLAEFSTDAGTMGAYTATSIDKPSEKNPDTVKERKPKWWWNSMGYRRLLPNGSEA